MYIFVDWQAWCCVPLSYFILVMGNILAMLILATKSTVGVDPSHDLPVSPAAVAAVAT